jgi:hypothetical protein
VRERFIRHPASRLATAVGLAVVAGIACQRGSSEGPGPLGPPGLGPAEGAEACPAPDGRGLVAIRFARDGRCLSGEDLVLYRCSRTSVPVLRLRSEERPVSYLGGAFAVPVQTLPANVRFVGSTDGLEVLIADPVRPSPSPPPTVSASVSGSPVPPVSASEPLVYVRQGGVTERWLRLERRAKVDDPPVTWLIGDSILDGQRDAVETALAGWAMTLDAEAGRPSSAGVPLAQDATEAGADVVLVELGTNDSSPGDFREHLVQTLDLLRDVPLVLWQTPRGPEGDLTIGSVNAAIRETVPAYPNAAIADWEAFVPPEAVETDGIHPDPGFESLESELLTPLLTGWRDAIAGDGATACGPRVVRATT